MLQMAVRRDYGIGVVEGALSSGSSPDQLRRWLAGRWALLFSHPDDFATYGFEADRWLVYLQDTFESLRLRPLAIGYDDGSGWISQTGGRFIPSYEADESVPQLRGCLLGRAGQSDHFVTILDGSARARRTFLYQPGRETPSLIELAHTAGQFRARSSPSPALRLLQSV